MPPIAGYKFPTGRRSAALRHRVDHALLGSCREPAHNEDYPRLGIDPVEGPDVYPHPGESSEVAHNLTRDDFSCRLIIICGKSPRRRFLRVLLRTECGEIAGSFSLGVTGR